MDVLSLMVGSMLGVLIGWTFSIASTKHRDAHLLRDKATKAKEREVRLKDEVKDSRDRSFADLVQGLFFYALGFCIIGLMGLILVNSI
jgi:hypothetical protein